MVEVATNQFVEHCRPSRRGMRFLPGFLRWHVPHKEPPKQVEAEQDPQTRVAYEALRKHALEVLPDLSGDLYPSPLLLGAVASTNPGFWAVDYRSRLPKDRCSDEPLRTNWDEDVDERLQKLLDLTNDALLGPSGKRDY